MGWHSYEIRGLGSYVLTEKLKALKCKLRTWNKDSFRRVEERKKTTFKKVEVWDSIEVMRPLSQREKELKPKAMEDFKSWVLMEETLWRQKSREIWLKEGDRNTGFFHKMENSHRRGNQILKMKIYGRWIYEEV